ncbi:hypothetical protein HDU91_005775 [Kappamyces sp. JEL0680]|nr:hypothetical protein HDU91_005775 [Kappamyces sp. JEL0680]
MVTLDSGESRLTWVLKVWSPTTGALQIFTWFSPPQCLLIYLSSLPSQGSLLLAAYFTAIFMHFTIDAYQQSVVDSKILSNELVSEGSGIHQPIVWSKAISAHNTPRKTQ